MASPPRLTTSRCLSPIEWAYVNRSRCQQIWIIDRTEYYLNSRSHRDSSRKRIVNVSLAARSVEIDFKIRPEIARIGWHQSIKVDATKSESLGIYQIADIVV
jgi:hypothetical protein